MSERKNVKKIVRNLVNRKDVLKLEIRKNVKHDPLPPPVEKIIYIS